MDTVLIPVPFHGETLFIVEHDGEPYVVMKAIVEAMGLAWSAQYSKLMSEKERWSVTISELSTSIGTRPTVIMPLRKFSGWINTLNVNKVGNAVRPKIALYQRESDDALWDYWQKGYAQNPRLLAPDPAVAQVIAMDGMQVLLVHEPREGLIATATAAEALLGWPRGTLRKKTKRDPILKAEYRLLCGDQLEAFKRALALPPTINIQATVTVRGLERSAELLGSARGRRLQKLLRGLMPTPQLSEGS